MNHPENIPSHMLYTFRNGAAVATKPRGSAAMWRPQYLNAGVPRVQSTMMPRAYPAASAVRITKANQHADGSRANRRPY